MPYFYLVTFFNGLVLIAALLLRRDNRLSHRLLSGIILSVLVGQGVVVMMLTGTIDRYPFLLHSRLPIQLLIPALFYLYILSLTIPGFQWTRRQSLHLLPFAFGLLIYLAFSVFAPVRENWKESREFLLQRYLFLAIAVLTISTYFIFCFRQLRRFQRIIPYYFSNFARVRLRWLQLLLVLFVIPWIIGWVDLLTGPSVIIIEKIIVPVVMILILITGFFGLRQSTIFRDEDFMVASEEANKPVLFTETELARWKDKLEKIMDEQKPYLEPDYHLTNLAQDLRLKPYQVTEILNRGVGVPFFDFINHYRIEEAKRRIKDSSFSHMKILAIAMDCGFNSKSSFNESFKKATGMTPSEFKSV